jgi:uncharacterized protein (DUF433 family)
MQTFVADRAYVTPIYGQNEAAHIIKAPVTSFGRWAHGHRFQQRQAGEQGWTPPILTGVKSGRGYTVPFNALAEGFIIESFRQVGLPMARIRPAIEVLRQEIGLENALLSERLQTDGAEILFRNGEDQLVVVRNHQGVFNDVVAEFLQSISYRDGFADYLRLPSFEGIEVVVDPRRNSGQPTVDRLGVRVEDIVSRVRAGEPMDEVAEDFGLERQELRSLVLQTA